MHLSTNAFAVGPFPTYAAYYKAIARDISRANHRCVILESFQVPIACKLINHDSCQPNALHGFDIGKMSHSLSALRPIRKGEEITLCYIAGVWMPYKKRQEILKNHYRFRCRCKVCLLTGAAREESDMRRALVRKHARPEFVAQLDAAFETWLEKGAPTQSSSGVSTSTSIPDSIQVARMLWNAMVKEECHEPFLWEPVLVQLVKGYAILEDEERVRYYATKAAELRTAFTGSDGGWLAVAEHPWETDWWARLGAKRNA